MNKNNNGKDGESKGEDKKFPTAETILKQINKTGKTKKGWQDDEDDEELE